MTFVGLVTGTKLQDLWQECIASSYNGTCSCDLLQVAETWQNCAFELFLSFVFEMQVTGIQ